MLSPGSIVIFGNCQNSFITRVTGWDGLMGIWPVLPHWNFNVAGTFLSSILGILGHCRPSFMRRCSCSSVFRVVIIRSHIHLIPLICFWPRHVALLAEQTSFSIIALFDIAFYFGSWFPVSVRSAFTSLTFFWMQRVAEMVWSGHWPWRMSEMI